MKTRYIHLNIIIFYLFFLLGFGLGNISIANCMLKENKLISINNKNMLPLDPRDWIPYFEKTKDANEPRDTLKIGLEYLKKEHKKAGLAVDLGAGTGRDTLYLLKNHWKVLAIDYSQKAIDILLTRVKNTKLNNLEVQVADMTQIILPKSINLVNASYSLPFIKPKDFPTVWKNIVQRIPQEGLFTGNFFGSEDDYARYKNVTILNKSQVYALFKGFKILYIHEDKGYSPDSTGANKQWDVWNVVAIKT